tara:strand:- start:239 stop:688 length:450 start_codon:yes stop_codon:yes gene_type:complete
MVSLNKVLLEIIANHTGIVLLLENNGSEIKDFLKKYKIEFKNISLNNDVIDDGMLILSPTDSNIIESYNKFGNLLINSQKKIIMIRKIDTEEFITDAHNIIMSLGFILAFKINQNNLFYLVYVYNISNYKKTPDWLNSENWANPELWEK